MRERVMGYIDGFNLYRGVEQAGWKRYLWHDPALLLENLLKPWQNLAGVKYFTARLSGSGAKWQHQKVLLEALETRERCSLHFGRFQEGSHLCPHCGCSTPASKEKMTDVSIAVEILGDAFQDLYDTAILISGDGDLVPAVRKVLDCSGKRIVVAFPPRRASDFLRAACSAHLMIGRGKLAASQLPDSIEKPDGTILTRPAEWS